MTSSLIENNDKKYLVGADLIYIHEIFKAEIAGYDAKNRLVINNKKIYFTKDAERDILKELRHINNKITLVH